MCQASDPFRKGSPFGLGLCKSVLAISGDTVSFESSIWDSLRERIIVFFWVFFFFFWKIGTVCTRLQSLALHSPRFLRRVPGPFMTLVQSSLFLNKTAPSLGQEDENSEPPSFPTILS